ncbi:MAG: RES family NAD+ phosphorylase [Candidatus Thiodiazotropha sp.]
MAGEDPVQISHVQWQPSWRLVSSRFPPVSLFDRVTDTEDLETIMEIEGLTNDRLREEVGDLFLVPEEDRITGPGTTPIMAAFTHLNPEGSRFSDGSYAIYYAANTIDTAIIETVFHRERFLKATNEPPIEIDMRSYASDIDNPFHDIRGQREEREDIYNPHTDMYGAAQAFANKLREEGSNGIVYDSVRDPDGECIAAFKPRILAPVYQGSHYCYVWDGNSIVGVYIKKEYQRG